MQKEPFLDNIESIKKNNDEKIEEWTIISSVIQEIIGEEKYKEVSRQKNRLGKHLFEIIDELNYINSYELVRIIHKTFSKACKKNLILANINDILVVKEGANIKYLYKEKEVNIVFIPDIESNREQVLLQFDEYNKLKNQSVDVSNAKKESFIGYTLEDLVIDALSKKASDIHFMYSNNFLNIQFRIFGKLTKQKKYTLAIENGNELLRRIRVEASKYTKGKFSSDEEFTVQDARIEYLNIGNGVDLRLSFLPDGKLTNSTLTIRLLVREKIKKAKLETKGYSEKAIHDMIKATQKKNGLFLVSGITGSGKSTLVSNLLTLIDNDRRVFSIEDPIEYIIDKPNVTQHQIFEPKDGKLKTSYQEYTKGLKRSDPDVVNIGEMRNDKELIKSATEMSSAGQLLFSTIHINSAYSIYNGMEKSFNVSTDVSVQLILFSINQCLVEKLCDNCKKEDIENKNIKKLKEERDEIKYAIKDGLDYFINNNEKTLYIRNASGCEKCNRTGVSGLLPLYEYFKPSVEFIEWISGSEKFPNRFAIERKVKEMGIGITKLDTYISLLECGSIECNDKNLAEIL